MSSESCSDNKLQEVQNELDDEMNPFEQTQVTNFNTNDCDEDEDDINTASSNLSPITSTCNIYNQSKFKPIYDNFQNPFCQQMRSPSK